MIDTTKVVAAVASARTELVNSITAERKVLADPKADVAAVAAASKSLQVAGRLDSILTSTQARLEKALKKLAPKAKKAKKAKTS